MQNLFILNIGKIFIEKDVLKIVTSLNAKEKHHNLITIVSSSLKKQILKVNDIEQVKYLDISGRFIAKSWLCIYEFPILKNEISIDIIQEMNIHYMGEIKDLIFHVDLDVEELFKTEKRELWKKKSMIEQHELIIRLYR